MSRWAVPKADGLKIEILDVKMGCPKGRQLSGGTLLPPERWKLVPPPPFVVPQAREDGPPPPPGGRLPSDGPPPPLGDRTTTVHAHLQAQKLQHKMKALSIPPPLAQARPRSQKSGQNGASNAHPVLRPCMRVTHVTAKHTQASNLTQSVVQCTNNSPNILLVLIHCRGHQVPWKPFPTLRLILNNWTCLPFGAGFGAGFAAG